MASPGSSLMVSVPFAILLNIDESENPEFAEIKRMLQDVISAGLLK